MLRTIDPNFLRTVLDYYPETGRLVWKPRPREMFSSKRSHTIWNLRYAGIEAMRPLTKRGYHFGSVSGMSLLAHRVIWAIVHGDWPLQIDHINGDRSDNRITNLRRADYGINARNHRLRKDNSSGRTGVYWHEKKRKWQAGINDRGRWKSLGHFTEKDAAIAAREAAERELGFHPNHGRAA